MLKFFNSSLFPILFQATDADSGPNGLITYEISSESDPFRRFKIEPQSGFISNIKSLEDVWPEELPLRLKVVARDNPPLRSAVMTQTTEVLVSYAKLQNFPNGEVPFTIRIKSVVLETVKKRMYECESMHVNM